MKLTFVHLPTFVADAERLGLSDEDIQALEAILLADPERGATIAGTGGVRKIRFAPPSWNVGKRGALRVIYVNVIAVQHVYFLVAYGKSEQANLTAEEKRLCRTLVAEIRQFHEESL